MELQLLNADLMQTRKPAFFKDTPFLFLVCKEGTAMTEYRVYMVKKLLSHQVCASCLKLQFLSRLLQHFRFYTLAENLRNDRLNGMWQSTAEALQSYTTQILTLVNTERTFGFLAALAAWL